MIRERNVLVTNFTRQGAIRAMRSRLDPGSLHPHRWSGALWLCLALVTACHQEPRRLSGLDGIQETGELRVLVRPGFNRGSAPGDGSVDEAELVGQLAARLQADVRWIEPSGHDQLIQWLMEGRGDLAVARFAPADLVGTAASPTSAVEWVEDLLVTAAEPTESVPEGLLGVVVHVQQSMVSGPLMGALLSRGLQVEQVPEDVSVEEILNRVRMGNYRLAVADSSMVAAVGGLGIIDTLSGPRPLVWAVRQANGRLRRAVDDYLFAEKVLARTMPISACRDLRQVRKARVLRLITRNSPTTYTVDRGGLQGFEYKLAHAFAREIGVRLELENPPPGIDPMWWLENGFGDVAALHEPVAPRDEGRFLVTIPYRWVDLVTVTPARRDPPSSIEDLAGVPVAAARPVAEMCRLLPVQPPIHAEPRSGDFDAPAAIREVSVGRIGVAVVDRDTAKLTLTGRPDLQLGTVVFPDVPLVWVLNPSSPELHRMAGSFLRRARVSGLVRQLVYSQLGSWRPHVPANFPEVPEGAITPYDEILQFVGRTEGIDWRLLASLMYEESRFDPEAIGPGGSAGLFQFMPLTWEDLDEEDPLHPGDAVTAGGWYLRWLMDKFSNLELPDQVAMGIASYNVGPRHVFDARALASNMGFDPDRWRGNVETAMLILDDAEVARRYPAGVCRCRRAVGYTRRILRRYRAYTEQFSP